MTRIEIIDFIHKKSVEELKGLCEGLSLINSGSPIDLSADQIDLLISLSDQEEWFRQLADLKIRKSELDEEAQARLKRNVPPARWA